LHLVGNLALLPPALLLFGALHGLAQTLLVEGLEQIIERVNLERRHHMIIGRHKDNERRAFSLGRRATDRPSSCGICTSRK
jgi:hypothetical protein